MNETAENSVSGHRKRLKARFLASSLDGFHDYEAIELLLMYAIPRRDVKPLAKDLLERFGGLGGLLDAPIEDLVKVPGVGESTARLLSMVRETGQAYLAEEGTSFGTVSCAEDAIDVVERHLSDQNPEQAFVVLYLNTKNDVLGIESLHEGPLADADLTPRSVIEKAFEHNARSVIFVHKVSEEFAFPSMFNASVAEGLKSAATAIDIIVHDYIVAARESHVSAREFGLLGP